MNNYISINFGELDSSNQDLLESLKSSPANVLISDTYENYYIQISDDSSTLQKFESLEKVFDFYAEFIISKGLMDYSKSFLIGLMQCTHDEDIDALYDFLETEGGEIQFVYDGDFDFTSDVLDPIINSFPNAPFCMIQRAEIEVEINNEELIFDVNSIELKDVFGYINDFIPTAGFYLN
jgi:hypothetical protein